MAFLNQAETRAFQIKASAAVTVFPYTAPAQFSAGRSGFLLDYDLTAIAGTTPTLVLTIQYYDTASLSYKTLLAGAALTAAGHQRLLVSPDVPAAANLVAQVPSPKQWNIVVAVSAGSVTTATFSLGVTYFS